MLLPISFSTFIYVLQVVSVMSVHHPAKKRQNFQDFCGTNGLDCGGGWCCSAGTECVKAEPEPLCRDAALTEIGGDPITFVALPFSSLQNMWTSNDAALTSLIDDLASISITLSVPSLASTETPSGFSGFSSYTDNVVPSISTFSIKETSSSTGEQGAKSTGVGNKKEAAVGMMAGGIVAGAAGMFMGI